MAEESEFVQVYFFMVCHLKQSNLKDLTAGTEGAVSH